MGEEAEYGFLNGCPINCGRYKPQLSPNRGPVDPMSPADVPTQPEKWSHEMRKLFISKALTMLMALALIGAVTAHAQDYDVVL